MATIYRAVKDNDNTNVICIGADENQANEPYHDMGVWCDFTFTEIPTLSDEANEFVAARENAGINALKVVDSKGDGKYDTIVVKTVEELTAEYPE